MTPNDVLYVYQAQIWWKSGFFDQPRTFHVVVTIIEINIIDKWTKWRRTMYYTPTRLRLDENGLFVYNAGISLHFMILKRYVLLIKHFFQQ